MRVFASRRFGPYRAGVSFGPEDFRQRRRGRPLASAPVSVRQHHFYYGLDLDADPLIEPQPHVYHPWRDLGTTITTLVWLLLWFAGVVILTVVVSFAALILIMK